jgi:hypothetical protein
VNDPDEAEFADSQSVWVGGVMPTQVLLARSDAAAVTLRGLAVFPDGFSFTVNTYIRRRSPGSRDRSSHGGGLAFHVHTDVDDDGNLAPHVLRFGLEFADGGRATNLDHVRDSTHVDDGTHGLQSGGGGGGDRSFSLRYWAWPVPTAGPLAVICEWPEYDIGEIRTEVPAELFAAALDQAHPIWPDWDGGLVHIAELGNGVVGEP